MSEKHKEIRSGKISVPAVVLGCLGLLALGVSLILITLGNSPTMVLLAAVAAYAVALAVFGVIWLVRYLKNLHRVEISESIFGTITLSFIQKLYMPVVICDEKGRVVWYNSALSSKFNSRGVLYGQYIDNICDASRCRSSAESLRSAMPI